LHKKQAGSNLVKFSYEKTIPEKEPPVAMSVSHNKAALNHPSSILGDTFDSTTVT